jgi:SIR2-like domain/TIR domain
MDSGTVGEDGPRRTAGEALPRVFISYRHDDMQGTAWALYGLLEARLGADQVFFDNGTLKPGTHWFESIKSHVAGANVFIALIGDDWAPSMDEHQRRGDADYVAAEVELALRNAPLVTVIPVLVDDTPPPQADALPPAIRGICAYQAERVRHTHLRADVDHLIDRVLELAHTRAASESVAALAGPPPSQQRFPVAEDRAPGAPDRDDGVRERRSQVAPTPDEDHYRAVAEEAANIVVFLGSAVNTEDGTLPDDAGLATYLAAKVKLASAPADLAEIAQYARAIRGEPRVFKWLKEGLTVDSESGFVHRYLARMPARFEELGLERRHQLIVTPKYDAALERALREANEPFDVAVYMRPSGSEPGHFLHIPYRGVPVAIDKPNEYRGFPIRASDDELTQTLVVRINGSVDDPEAGYDRVDNYVITEDHYIEYLTGGSAEALIPAQILTKLRNSNCLFLGYQMSDWRLRVFLRRVWDNERLGRSRHWAVQREPAVLERQLCADAGIALYESSLVDYVEGFDRFISEHAPELKE